MSFALTTPQILNRSKTVTRRLGWRFLKRGDLVQAVEKSQGLKKGQTVRKLAVLRVINVRQEPLYMLEDDYGRDSYGRGEVDREGFRGRSVEWFRDMFIATHRGCTPETVVTRIEFEYVEAASGRPGAGDGA